MVGMCGIAGVMCAKRQQCDTGAAWHLLKKMTDCIAHRGPDGEGHIALDEGHVFLGHRRLAIIDLSNTARQPMQSLDQRYTISYNGEVYNYKDLRRELEFKGYRFFSSSDTEVILHAYAQWGTDALPKLNGIFAFAIWDDYKKEMILVRDRYGTKPLYYAKIGNQFVFASEYKALLLHPQFEKKLNLFAVKQYFTFQNIFDTQTFLQGVYLLEAGSYIKIGYETEQIPKPIVWWDYDFTESDKRITRQEYQDELDRLFKQAVKRQMVSDVDVGAYLSGGIDSGAITAIAAKERPYMKTFTCGFDLHSVSGVELSYDEREKAEYMSYLFQTEHYEVILKAGDMQRCMKKLVWHLEDPRVGQSYPNFYAAKLSSHFVKVVLAGCGGDELFAGYPWRYYRAVNCKKINEYISNYYTYWQRLLNNEEIERFFNPIYSAIKDYSTEDLFCRILHGIQLKDISPEQSVNYSLYLEAKTFLHGLLMVEDKLSMAHGMEERVPFLDNDLVQFAMKVPIRMKLANFQNVNILNENEYGAKVEHYYKKNKDGKLILRDVMGRYIPKKISRGAKQGFSAPDASWFKGESMDYVKDIILNPNAYIYEYMDRKSVENALKKHADGEENKRLLIWSIINFEEWLSLFLKEKREFI